MNEKHKKLIILGTTALIIVLAYIFLQKVDTFTLTEFGNLKVKSRFSSRTAILGGRIVPKGIGYVLELLYAKKIPQNSQQSPTRIAGIDLGINNLITMGNNIGKQPIVIKGGVVKSINQYYNKRRAKIQQIYLKQGLRYGRKYRELVQKRDLKSLLTKGLTRAERLIIVLYYYEEMTMKEIGATLDLSESRVSQMHSSIIARLKAQMNSRKKEFAIQK